MGVRVLGVDGSPDGWIGVALDDDVLRAYAAPTLARLIEQAQVDGAPTWVGVDIPIGLSHDQPRLADIVVRRALGARSASLFSTPVRSALMLPDYGAAVAQQRRITASGFSRQAFGLRSKILEVDALVAGAERRVFEVHPELSFTVMAGRPARNGKKTWAGLQERLGLLAEQGLVLDSQLWGTTGRAGADDVLDAAAAAWTARRRAAGAAQPWPDPPQPLTVGSDGAEWPGAIWA